MIVHTNGGEQKIYINILLGLGYRMVANPPYLKAFCSVVLPKVFVFKVEYYFKNTIKFGCVFIVPQFQ